MLQKFEVLLEADGLEHVPNHPRLYRPDCVSTTLATADAQGKAGTSPSGAARTLCVSFSTRALLMDEPRGAVVINLAAHLAMCCNLLF
jgi:hypothetical protein